MKTVFTLALCLCSCLFGQAEQIYLLAPESDGQPGTFTDPLKAVEAINAAGGAVTLHVAPGVYWLDSPDDPAIRTNPRGNGEVPYAVEIACDSLAIIGLDPNPENTVWAVNRGQTQGALGNYTMIHFTGRALTAENITFGNYCNVDLVYPADLSRNRPKRRDAIVQAQIGWLDGTDKLFARNCRFISRLNLCPLTGARRSMYKDCWFECTDDALTGSAVYQDCSFCFHSGKPFYSTASTGAVFLNCDIHSLTEGTQYLTKVPGQVTLIDTRFTSPSDSLQLLWTRDASSVRCYQSNVSLNGKGLIVDAKRPELSCILDSTALMDAYKVTMPDGTVIYNTPNLLGGLDGWDPLGMLPQVRQAEETLGRKLTGLPVALHVSSSEHTLDSYGHDFTVTATPKLWGDYVVDFDAEYAWNSPESVVILPDNSRVNALSHNRAPHFTDATISVTASNGLVGACTVNMKPYLTEAPKFTSQPVLWGRKDGSIMVDYDLEGTAEDESYIVWYRATRSDMSDSIPVRHGHGVSARTYSMSASDVGSYINAVVHPRRYGTLQGTPAMPPTPCLTDSKVRVEISLETSFAEIPIRRSTAHGARGRWHFDTYKPADTALHQWEADSTSAGWYYGKGVDAATGTGLVQAVKGARMSYIPVRQSSETMRVSLVAEPAKGPGQGFGSATGQYLDICLKYDPATLTGYSLRIERTPDYDKAVTFTLMQHHNGEATPLTEPVATSCFRTPCSIAVELNGDRLSASASTAAKEVHPADPRILPSVNLSATVTPTLASGFMVQHTGSTGSSATLLRDLEINWE